MKGPEAVIDRIEHMREAITELRRVVLERPRAELMQDWMAIRGVERAIEIISEASRHIPQDFKEDEPQIPWRNIARIGNIIRHEYSGVSSELLLGVVEDDLPDLDDALVRILERLGQG